MAITVAERNTLIDALLAALDTDAQKFGIIVSRLETRFPTVNFRQALQARATVWQPFIDTGLSIQWWIGEVGRYADFEAGL